MPLASGTIPALSFLTLLKMSTVPALSRLKRMSSGIPAPVIFITLVLAIMSINMNAQMLPKNSTVRFLALGDSYTIGESVAELQRWPMQLAEGLRMRGYNCQSPVIVAVTGWRTDQLQSAITERKLDKNYDLVSLLIGVNNQYQGRSIHEYEREFANLLEFAIQHAGKRKSNVIVLSIPDYGYTPFGKEKQQHISAEIDAFNAANKRITQEYGVSYINITDISRQGMKHPELVAADGLHPSGKMYALWVSEILRSCKL